MILGTVEIGMDYGINNAEGKPTNEQAYNLLDSAWNNGILELDTAVGYGDSETIIGRYQKETSNTFLIDTKIPSHVSYKHFEECVTESCKRLNVDFVNILYLHSFEQCKQDGVLSSLKQLKEKGLVNKIGLSIYEPSEMRYIIDNLDCVEVIQFPFSILDSYRWLDNDLLSEAKSTNKTLYVRSIFSQGLIFKKPTDPFVRKIKASRYLESIREQAEKNNVTIAEMAYKYVLNVCEIDNILIGCQNSEELMINLKNEKSVKELDATLISILNELTRDVSDEIIDPRKW